MSGSAHPGRKRPKKHEEEEHENHERWLVSYADMVTLLMCLFIVLFAMSQVDKAKFAALAVGPVRQLRRARSPRCPARRPPGSVLDALPAPVDIAPASPPASRPPRPRSTRPPPRPPPSGRRASPPRPQGAYDELAAARDKIDAALSEAGYGGAARYEIDERGLVVHIVADAVLFDAEEAVLRPEGKAILDAVAPTLTGAAQRAARRGPRQPPAGHAGRPVAVELGAVGLPGHHRAAPTWPATACPEPRMYAAGYGSTQPLVPVTDPHGDHRQPPGRHRRPVQRLGRGQRPAAGHRRRTSRSHAMSTKEKAPETDEARQGRQEEAAPDRPRAAARRGRGGVLLPVLRRRPRPTEPVSSGTFLALDPVAVNLAGGGYLKIGVALELTEDGAAAARAVGWTAPRPPT